MKEITYREFLNWIEACDVALKNGNPSWTAERTMAHIMNICHFANATGAEVRFLGTLVGNIVTKVLVMIDIQPSGNGFDMLTKRHEEYVFVARNL